MTQDLRPIERRVLAMRNQGVAVHEIARRLRKSPAHVERLIEWTAIPRSGPVARRSPRPLEQRVLALRATGESHEQIAGRFHKSPAFIQRVEGLAHYARAIELLG